MIFSKACEYSIRASIFITLHSLEGKRVNLKEISKKIDSPEAFTAKILQQLKRNNIVKSVQGISGGFEIDKEQMKNVKLCHIVNAIDGEQKANMCLMGLKECSEHQPCPVHHHFKSIKSKLNSLLQNTSLLTMANDVKQGTSFLNLKY